MNKGLALIVGGVAISVGLLSHVALTAPSEPAMAPGGSGLGFCNRSNRGRVAIAVAYPVDEKKWKTEGWLSLDEQECSTIIHGELKNRYYYFFAESDDGYAWKGTHQFCVSDNSFTLIQADRECEGKEMRWAGFRELDTGRRVPSLMLNLE